MSTAGSEHPVSRLDEPEPGVTNRAELPGAQNAVNVSCTMGLPSEGLMEMVQFVPEDTVTIAEVEVVPGELIWPSALRRVPPSQIPVGFVYATACRRGIVLLMLTWA
eukprot:RCo051832